jgi:hypothetical protein
METSEKNDWAAIENIAFKAIKTHKGNARLLEGALGALCMGYFLGWKVLRVIHSAPTLVKYERCLSKALKEPFKYSDYLPASTDLSRRSVGYRWIEDAESFWTAIKTVVIPKDERATLK